MTQISRGGDEHIGSWWKVLLGRQERETDPKLSCGLNQDHMVNTKWVLPTTALTWRTTKKTSFPGSGQVKWILGQISWMFYEFRRDAYTVLVFYIFLIFGEKKNWGCLHLFPQKEATICIIIPKTLHKTISYGSDSHLFNTSGLGYLRLVSSLG